MAAAPRALNLNLLRARLLPFEAGLAPLVASWVGGPDEALRLAPNSAPPLTADVVRSWSRQSGRHARVLVNNAGIPAAYGELNLLNAERREYWLGHLIVDPQQRKQGIGTRLTQLLLERAFMQLAATRVALVVFTDNPAAIACYRACGLIDEQFELQHFWAYDRYEKLLRMGITRQRWAELRRAAAISPR